MKARFQKVGLIFRPLALWVWSSLLIKLAIICKPALIFVLIACLQYEDLVSHDIWNAVQLLLSERRHISCKGLQPSTNVCTDTIHKYFAITRLSMLIVQYRYPLLLRSPDASFFSATLSASVGYCRCLLSSSPYEACIRGQGLGICGVDLSNWPLSRFFLGVMIAQYHSSGRGTLLHAHVWGLRMC